MTLVELREYQIKPGKTQQWLNWMKEELIPYQQSKGMKILDTYLYQDEHGVEYFVWLREFASAAERDRIYQATYTPWWVNEIRPKVFSLIEEHTIKVRILNPKSLMA